MTLVKPDWRFFVADETGFTGSEWRQSRGITAVGTVYLIDVNLHVYICSATPVLEAWDVQTIVEFESKEFAEKDEGMSEIEITSGSEGVVYFDTDVGENTPLSAEKYAPQIEEGENYADYRRRVADEVREHLAGNPISFEDVWKK